MSLLSEPSYPSLASSVGDLRVCSSRLRIRCLDGSNVLNVLIAATEAPDCIPKHRTSASSNSPHLQSFTRNY